VSTESWTRRQHEAFWQWRYAFERVLLLKSTTVHTAEESKARWDRLIHAQTVLRNALEALEASVVDECDASGRGISQMPVHTPLVEQAKQVVWADEVSPFTGRQVLDLLKENQRFRDALEKIEGGEGCSTPSYGDCCDMACARIARAALASPPSSEETKGSNG